MYKRALYLLIPLMLLLVISVVLAQQKGMMKRINNNESKECIALVIGNASYKEAPLNNPVNDAQDMAKALGELGFTVIIKTNASLREMDEGLDEFTNKMSNGCVGLFYYSGHGIQYEGINYLIPVDANINRESDIKYAALNANKILDYMRDENGNGMNIIILDACRNNPFRKFRSLGRGLAETTASLGFIIGYATSPGSVASDGTERNGVYTNYLLSAMKTPGLTIENVFKRVLQGTSSETQGKQTPWVSSSFVGDFYFIPPSDITPLTPNEIIGNDGAEMVLIPAGEFLMGSDIFTNEQPIHKVYLDEFYMDKYEVTNAQYKKFMDATGHKAPPHWKDIKFNSPNQPVVCIAWEDATAYAQWAGKRLPTEAMWEKAARGGLVGKLYSWGDSVPDGSQCNTADVSLTDVEWANTEINDGYKYTSPVGSFPPNGYGLYDMVGNVYEWCYDWYDEKYYTESDKSNPIGPNLGSQHVLRGGSWLDSMTHAFRVAYRNLSSPSTTISNNFGFRCVQDVPK